MQSDNRPLKRARLSDPDSTSNSSTSSSAFKLHDEFWLPDGNVVLVARAIGFRVYRGLIAAQSTVFEDMFTASTSSSDSLFEGCPVVHLSDSPEDLVYLLRVLLPKSRRLYNRPELRTFNEVSALIRLAHKYHIQDVQDQALASLRESMLSSHFDDWYKPLRMTSITTIHTIGVINLARLTDTPSMLPGAFYGCTRLSPGELLDGLVREDGTVEHLSQDDLRLCLEGHRTLYFESSLLPTRIFADTPIAGCSTPSGCRLWCQRKLVGIVSSETLIAQPNALGSWQGAIKAAAADEKEGATKICGTCEKELLHRDRRERRIIWQKLPEIFGITVEGWGVGADGEGVGTVHA
ncbi:hypothetical protein LXA43DRAFT_1090965 [Ganoderma leucocontextum]|nr:hypothetical protein LXA43DRAFT_1090965 [Ganoderma leucocontextum]